MMEKTLKLFEIRENKVDSVYSAVYYFAENSEEAIQLAFQDGFIENKDTIEAFERRIDRGFVFAFKSNGQIVENTEF